MAEKGAVWRQRDINLELALGRRAARSEAQRRELEIQRHDSMAHQRSAQLWEWRSLPGESAELERKKDPGHSLEEI